jgi:hypothetical protein
MGCVKIKERLSKWGRSSSNMQEVCTKTANLVRSKEWKYSIGHTVESDAIKEAKHMKCSEQILQ